MLRKVGSGFPNLIAWIYCELWITAKLQEVRLDLQQNYGEDKREDNINQLEQE